MKPTEKLAFTRRIRQLSTIAGQYNADARELAGTLLTAWSAASFPALGRPALPSRRELAKHPQVAAFVKALQSLDFLSAAYWLSSGYAIWGDSEYRKKVAMYFTPPSITWRLLEDLRAQGVDFKSQTFYDPACGGAAFLAPIALRMRDELRKEGRQARTILKTVQAHIVGTDVDETLCEMSRHFLRMVLVNEISLTGVTPRFQVRKANSLTAANSLHGKVDIVICNPPYRKLPADEVEPYRERYKGIIEAQPNLYGLFVGLALKLLKIGGVAALVTPTSYLSGQYFSGLRKHILRNADVLRIGMIGDRKGIYIDVEQETALTFLKRKPETDSYDTTTTVSLVDADGTYKDVGLCQLPNSGTTWPIPRANGDEELLRAAGSATANIAAYGYAIRAGSFVWNRDKRATYRNAKAAARARARSAVPLLWSRDIKDGTLAFERERNLTDGDSFVDLGSKEHTYVVRRPSVLLQRVTSNEMPRRLVAAPVLNDFLETYGGFVGENHIVVLEQVDDNAHLGPEELSELLSTSTVDRYFRCLSGATNVSAFELGQVKLPDPVLLRRHLEEGLSMEEAVRKAFWV